MHLLATAVHVPVPALTGNRESRYGEDADAGFMRGFAEANQEGAGGPALEGSDGFLSCYSSVEPRLAESEVHLPAK